MKKKNPDKHGESVNDLISEDLRSQLRFNSDSGKIWLRENRMLLVHAQAKGDMRRELIESFGGDCVSGLFFRIGYASGVRDFELVRVNTEVTSDIDAFKAGPLIYAMEGGVKTTIVELELNCKKGILNGTIMCEHSWEAQAHLRDFGESPEGVCWTLMGYASGYTSALMGKPILWREVECLSQAKPHCVLVGKPADEWECADKFTRYMNQDLTTDQPLCACTPFSKNHSNLIKDKLPSELIGRSPAFIAAYELLVQASSSEITVLLLGETGVGKEVFARLLHTKGVRSKGPFIAINCAAIPSDLVESELFGVAKGAFTGAETTRPGRFQRANGGTLFLDEIGDMPLSAQVKLLRVLQEGVVERLGGTTEEMVDVRLVAASNVDLRPLIESGKFRADLYYRINVLQINIPPLRERGLDVLLIANKFLKRYSLSYSKKLSGFTDKAKQFLIDHQWSGNIRELQNIVERGALLAPDNSQVEICHLFPLDSNNGSLYYGFNSTGELTNNQKEHGKTYCDAILSGKITIDQANNLLLKTALEKANGNISAAGRLVGLTRAQFAYRLEKLI